MSVAPLVILGCLLLNVAIVFWVLYAPLRTLQRHYVLVCVCVCVCLYHCMCVCLYKNGIPVKLSDIGTSLLAVK